MAKIIAFGDSFTWGSDMADTMRDFEWNAMPEEWKQDRKNGFHNLYSRHTWQALMAQDKGMEYVCLAEQGCSNQSIVRKFFENVHLIEKGDTVSINFTWRDRYDFYNDVEGKWETLRPSGTEDNPLFEMYYKHMHSSVWDQVESLKAINLVLDYMKLSNISFIATCIDDKIYHGVHHNTPLIKILQEQNEERIWWFEGLGFHEWSKVNNYEISPMWHPLEEAHKAAYQYLKDEKLV